MILLVYENVWGQCSFVRPPFPGYLGSTFWSTERTGLLFGLLIAFHWKDFLFYFKFHFSGRKLVKNLKDICFFYYITKTGEIIGLNKYWVKICACTCSSLHFFLYLSINRVFYLLINSLMNFKNMCIVIFSCAHKNRICFQSLYRTGWLMNIHQFNSHLHSVTSLVEIVILTE